MTSEDDTVVDGTPLRPDDEDSSDLIATSRLKRSLPPLATGPTAASAGTARTTESVLLLRNEEAARTVALMRLVAPVTAMAIAALWLSDRTDGRVLCTAVFGVTLVVTLWLLARFRDPSRFDVGLAVLQGMLCVAAILVAAMFVGIFSPVIMAACIGIYFFGQSDSEWAGWAIYLACGLGYGALCLAALLEVVPLNNAVVAIETPYFRGLWVLSVMIQVVLALTFWMAQKTRRATREAFERLDRAARQIRQREALLNEVRAELDNAQAARLGRYSGRTVGNYLVDEVIGRGAMGEVYQARDLTKDQLVALKFLHPMALEDSAILQRFFREAEAAGAIRSSHVVRVLATGTAEDGAPFIAMERLDGVDLSERLRDKKRLSVKEVIGIVHDVAEALMAADAAGIVHRDLKPQNVFRAEEGRRRTWKVLDFGVSKVRESAATLTQGNAIGTPSYMAPEQAMGKDVDHRADVFALGVIAYRALTGRPAFTAPDSVTTLYNVVHTQPAKPGDLAKMDPDVERALCLVLAKDPERRFRSATMFAAALADAAVGRLDDRLREHADRLIREQPWGREIR
ncbi:MAG: serine/threonine protein kinase [Myxococcales bacterium]|nr:serine/threonine protein kinase [Myxococcales bacterium]MCB9575492.1 serine/threonine protein kinase [Polyangiaceae bacterium]